MRKVLILAPHTDDGELGCGATISKLIRQGAQVYYVAFSSCVDSLPAAAAPDPLSRDMHRATTALGIPEENTRVLDFQVRHFEDHRQDVLESMVKLNREIDPDIVFSPSVHDVHQDHATIANECQRCFKKKTIYQYEAPWNNFTFDNQVFCCVTEEDVENKIRAIQCYDSQAGRDYVHPDFLRGLLITHGVQIGRRYAEVFEVPRLIFNEGESL